MVRSAKTLGVYAVRQWFVPIPHAVKAPTTKITPAPHCTGTDQTPTQPIQVIISVDATPFFKASATRGDVWVDCWGGKFTRLFGYASNVWRFNLASCYNNYALPNQEN